MKTQITILITILLIMFFCQTIFASFEDIEIMVKAAWGGDNETLINYLSSGKVNVDDKNIFGSNALMAASQTGNVDLVKLLVEKYNANVNVKNKYGRTALMLADYSSYDIMKILLSNGADVHVRNSDGSTTLMLVAGCYDNYVEVVKLLISYGADVNAKDNEGKTVIDYAKSAILGFEEEKQPDKKEIIKILSENGKKQKEIKTNLNDLVIINNTSFISRYFIKGNFYILVPKENIDYHTFTENILDTSLIHHNYAIRDKQNRIGIVINYTELNNFQISKEINDNIYNEIYEDIINRMDKYKLLYRKKVSLFPLTGEEFALQRKSNENDFIVIRIYIINSNLYTIKVLIPYLKDCITIHESFEVKSEK